MWLAWFVPAGSSYLDVASHKYDFRICGRGFNYGRLVTTNASVLTYEHVSNANGVVYDTWSIVKTQS